MNWTLRNKLKWNFSQKYCQKLFHWRWGNCIVDPMPPSNLEDMDKWQITLQWRHNGHDSVSNHQPHDCLLNRLFRRRSKKTSKLRVTGLCAGNSPGTGEFPAQMASKAENVSIWWRHHDSKVWTVCMIAGNYDIMICIFVDNKTDFKPSSTMVLTCLQRHLPGLILGLHPTNERQRYCVATSLIGWAQT